MPPGLSAPELYLAAVRRGVAFAVGSVFYTDGSGHDRLRINFGAHPPERIEEGMQRLGRAWRELIDEMAARGESGPLERAGYLL